MFIKNNDNFFIALQVYVDDDIIVAKNDLDSITNLKKYLDYAFNIKDLGDVGYFLRIEVAKTSIRLNLCHMTYTLDILQKCGFLESKLVSASMVPGQKLPHMMALFLKMPVSTKGLYADFFF